MAHIVEQPMNLVLEYYHNANRPRLSGSEQIRLEVAALWPTAAALAAKEKEEREAKKREAHRKPPT